MTTYIYFKDPSGHNIASVETNGIIPVVGDYVEIPSNAKGENEKIVCGQVIKRQVEFKRFSLPSVVNIWIV